MATIEKLLLLKSSIIGGKYKLYIQISFFIAYSKVIFILRWKANIVFDHVTITKNYDGYFLFLEEDHYVTPDFLYVLKLIETKTFEDCKECNILVLGKHKVPTSNILFNNNDVSI